MAVSRELEWAKTCELCASGVIKLWCKRGVSATGETQVDST